MSAKCWLYSQQLSVAVDSVRAGVGTVASSESGLRFAALAPQLLAAKDLTELVEDAWLENPVKPSAKKPNLMVEELWRPDFTLTWYQTKNISMVFFG